ncbi:hypothetical protein FQZ97_899540 [compost metagenome]
MCCRICAVQRQAHCKCAAHRAKLSAQRELACEFPARQPRGVDLAAGGQDAQRDRQVEAPRVLGQVGRRQVHRDALVGRELQPGVGDGRAHAFAGFLHLGVGQAHQREAGQAVGQVDFDLHGPRVQAEQGAAAHQRQTHRNSLPVSVRVFRRPRGWTAFCVGTRLVRTRKVRACAVGWMAPLGDLGRLFTPPRRPL